jgi:hypothetical protein
MLSATLVIPLASTGGMIVALERSGSPEHNPVQLRPANWGGAVLSVAVDRPRGRSHSDAWVCCMVWSTTDQQFAGQGGKVDLVTQTGAEDGDDLGGVVAAVETASTPCWMRRPRPG